MKHFQLSEFDCKSTPGSAINMQSDFLQMIDNARDFADIPFVINSGYRTQKHNQYLINQGFAASPNSSHLEGRASDIHCTIATRETIVRACVKAGFRRIGIANTFIHVDNDQEKKSPAVWLYDGVDKRLFKWCMNLIKEYENT